MVCLLVIVLASQLVPHFPLVPSQSTCTIKPERSFQNVSSELVSCYVLIVILTSLLVWFTHAPLCDLSYQVLSLYFSVTPASYLSVNTPIYRGICSTPLRSLHLPSLELTSHCLAHSIPPISSDGISHLEQHRAALAPYPGLFSSVGFYLALCW